jgi:hypothetical protein
MRVVEQRMINAINNRTSFHAGNTRVDWVDHCNTNAAPKYCDRCEIRLHNNLIATLNFRSGAMQLFSAGWRTNTTKSRLNAILHEFAGSEWSIYQRKWGWFWSDGEVFSDGDVIAIK